MLTQLSVRNHTLVEYLDIEFQSGLSAITGETGAGKSILLNALGLTLGDRADFDQVRIGANRAEIHTQFNISNLPQAQAFLQQHELDDEGECLLRRVINTNGSSKAWINGQPVNLSVLRNLAEQLISIHSQHEHQALLRQDIQQTLLDDYAGSKKLVTQTSHAFKRWKEKSAQLTDLEANMAQHVQRKELLEFQLNEFSLLGLTEGEFEALEEEQKQLANAEHIQRTLYQAIQALAEDETANVLAGLRQVNNLTDTMDIKNSSLDEARQMIYDSLAQLEESRDLLRRTADQIIMDPERLMEVDSRLSTAFELSRKHRCLPQELCSFQEEMQQELDGLGKLDSNLDKLRTEIESLEIEYYRLANQLTEQRTSAASQLETDVQPHLNELNMEGAELQIALNKVSPSSSGLEQCEFLIRTNPGQKHKPLAKIASGGELSRVSLAIQVVTAGSSKSPTLVFDEVDVGIGGSTATVIGQKLRSLGTHAQVICITHLAQVASQAHQHLSVSKISSEDRVRTEIKPIDNQDRKEEIARMLSGNTKSEHSLKHAEELLVAAETQPG